MLRDLVNNNAFSRKNMFTFWKCMSCGYEVAINELSEDYSCPSCGHFKSYFQRKSLHLVPDERSLEQRDVSGWVCMECGYEAAFEVLPDDWKCVSCGRSKSYFKRKILKPKDYIISSTEREKAHWVCLECGNEEEIDMPVGWKCPKCGFPQHNGSD